MFPPTATLISRLPQDALYEIFSFIAVPVLQTTPGWEPQVTFPKGRSQSHLRPLSVLRKGSQVCRTWRKMLLDSPVLWGRAIDFDVLVFADNEWREEVTKRTKTAPLFVTGSLDKTTDKILSSFLAKYWSRVEVLEIHSEQSWPGPDGYVFSPNDWSFLAQPTNTIKHFVLKIPTTSDMDHQLFSGNAPSIRFFSTHRIFHHINPSWAANLHHLEIQIVATYHEPRLTAQEIFSALMVAHTLEVLILVGSLEEKPAGRLQKINLPNLRHITINDTVFACNTVLGNITARRGCCLSVDACDEPDFVDATPDDLLTTRDLCMGYFTQYYELHAPQESHFQISDLKDSHFLAITPSENRPIDTQEGSSEGFAVMIDASMTSTRTPRNFVEGLVGLDFSSIISLDLEMDPEEVEPSSPYFLSFLSSFGSVTTLMTNLQTLDSVLNHLPSFEPLKTPLFPSLVTLKICTSYDPVSMDLETLQPVLSFLQRRSDLRKAIQILDLADLFRYPYIHQNDESNDASNVVAKIEGLDVLWTKPVNILV
ncbi:unnamed protein product [Cyclocybe aegerita]|uniref:F-box domain-containing protein n=1 Tax=Cyclocybe aegerita TaxID=1973307 RepID=A0A8S0VUK8_CYCAE|nr:unnamed protein product [Cyclocybe aegerita]